MTCPGKKTRQGAGKAAKPFVLLHGITPLFACMKEDAAREVIVPSFSRPLCMHRGDRPPGAGCRRRGGCREHLDRVGGREGYRTLRQLAAVSPKVVRRMKGRLLREEKTIRVMIEMYCRDRHGSKGALCSRCRELCEYAEKRLRNCPYGAKKPTCAACPIHCYQGGMREEVRRVMRYAGPRMMFEHPLLAIGHFIDGLACVRPPRPGA